MGFRDSKSADNSSKYILKFEPGKTYILKIVKDVLKEWNEVWPTFLKPSGKSLRRFVVDDDLQALAPIEAFKKTHDLKKMLGGDQRSVDNWNIKGQKATLVIVGTEQTVKDKATGKKKVVINWDRSVKIWQFGIRAFRALHSINHNPDLIERAEAVEALKDKMADPDDPKDLRYLCTDVYAIRLEKKKSKGQVEYDIQPGKLIGVIKNLEDLEVVEEELEKHTKPNTAGQISQFISSNMGEDADEDEAESTEDADDDSTEEAAEDTETEEAAATEDIDLDSEDEEEMPPPKKGKATPPPAKSAVKKSSAPTTKKKAPEPEEADDEDGVEDIEDLEIEDVE